MEVKEYKKKALRTANTELFSKKDLLLNGAMGLNGEAGEVIDILKKFLFQGHKLDKKEILNEVGDCLWYCNLIAYSLNTDLSEIMKFNIEKLEKRYKNNKFTIDESVNRIE